MVIADVCNKSFDLKDKEATEQGGDNNLGDKDQLGRESEAMALVIWS